MGRVVDINTIAEQLLKQYRDIPSLDKSQKMLVAKYGDKQFVAIRKRFAQLWLKQNGIDARSQPAQERVTEKVGRMIVSYWVNKPCTASGQSSISGIKPKSQKKRGIPMFPGRVVHVPKAMRSTSGRKVVTRWTDSEESSSPIHVSLKVIRTMTFGGCLCYVVKYGPNGVEPYEWHLPITDKYSLNKSEVQCIFYKSSLMIDNRSKRPVVYEPGNTYTFLVLSLRQSKEGYQIECYDQNGRIHEIYTDVYINVGSMIRCKVKDIKVSAGEDAPFSLSIVKDEVKRRTFLTKNQVESINLEKMQMREVGMFILY